MKKIVLWETDILDILKPVLEKKYDTKLGRHYCMEQGKSNGAFNTCVSFYIDDE